MKLKFWVIWNERGRAPVHKHYDRQAAESEAARLAQNNPGHEFHILESQQTVFLNNVTVLQHGDAGDLQAEKASHPHSEVRNERRVF